MNTRGCGARLGSAYPLASDETAENGTWPIRVCSCFSASATLTRGAETSAKVKLTAGTSLANGNSSPRWNSDRGAQTGKHSAGNVTKPRLIRVSAARIGEVTNVALLNLPTEHQGGTRSSAEALPQSLPSANASRWWSCAATLPVLWSCIQLAWRLSARRGWMRGPPAKSWKERHGRDIRGTGRDAADLLDNGLEVDYSANVSLDNFAPRILRSSRRRRSGLRLACLYAAIFSPLPLVGAPRVTTGLRKNQIVDRAQTVLSETRSVDQKTKVLGEKAVTGFWCWIQESKPGTSLDEILAIPPLVDKLVTAYGKVIYYENEPIHLLRHLITALARMQVQLRKQMPTSWELVTNWEELEPTVHRRPMPLRLLQAMATLGVSQGHLFFVAVLLTIFFGITRAGEVTESKREWVLLPAEVGSGYNEIIVHHASPKTKRRGARVQYSTVDDPQAVKFIGEVFARRARYQSLLPGGSKCFRLIFNELLGSLGVPAGIFVPAGLRGGGACAYYKEFRDVQTLAWRMRLQHQHTLCHYLQEVTSAASLAGLPAATQRKVSAAAALYDVIFEPPS